MIALRCVVVDVVGEERKIVEGKDLPSNATAKTATE
jgi:hypothetical protein